MKNAQKCRKFDRWGTFNRCIFRLECGRKTAHELGGGTKKVHPRNFFLFFSFFFIFFYFFRKKKNLEKILQK